MAAVERKAAVDLGPQLQASYAAVNRALGPDPEDQFLGGKVRAVLTAYDRCWSGAAWRVEAVEPSVARPIVNPATGSNSRTFVLAATSAAVVSDGTRQCVLAPIITREEIEQPDNSFWQRLAIEAPICAVAAPQAAGATIEGVLFDVLRRPELRPRMVPRGSPKKSLDENRGSQLELDQGTYCGLSLDAAQIPELKRRLAEDDSREPLVLFELRVLAEVLAQPARYLQRRVRVVGRDDAERCQAELWQTAIDLRLAQRFGRHYRNSGACLAFGAPCEYLPLCSGCASPEDAAWTLGDALSAEVREKPPANSEQSSSYLEQLLTPRRCQCFQLCRRKHFYRYELGLRSVEQHAAESRRFASLVYTALVAWWDAMRGASSRA